MSRTMSGIRGFFEALFDFSFTEFVTAKLVKVIYGAAIALWSILALVVLLGALASSGIALLGALILVPVGLLVAVTEKRTKPELDAYVEAVAEEIG